MCTHRYYTARMRKFFLLYVLDGGFFRILFPFGARFCLRSPRRIFPLYPFWENHGAITATGARGEIYYDPYFVGRAKWIFTELFKPKKTIFCSLIPLVSFFCNKICNGIFKRTGLFCKYLFIYLKEFCRREAPFSSYRGAEIALKENTPPSHP